VIASCTSMHNADYFSIKIIIKKSLQQFIVLVVRKNDFVRKSLLKWLMGVSFVGSCLDSYVGCILKPFYFARSDVSLRLHQ